MSGVIDLTFRCERCGRTDDAIAAVGRRSLCTDCRQALDLCTLCAAPTLHGEWWCPECEFTWLDGIDGEIAALI